MAKHSPESRPATETLEEIEGAFDRVATWVSENPKPVLGAVGAVLGLAAILGGAQALQTRSADSASEALAEVQSEYLEAMGATPGTLEVVEPANPERAREIREEYVARFLEVAAAHDGTGSAVAARLEAGGIQATLGDPAGALETLREAADEAPRGALEALARARLAAALESQEQPGEAAEQWARAGEIEHPARDLALAQAARLYATLGDETRALALYDQIDAEASSVTLPPHLTARLDELRAARDAAVPAS